VRVQAVAATDRSTWKDFTIAIDPTTFGTDRDTLRRVLDAEGVDTRTYFDPPVHRQTAYRDVVAGPLPVTDEVCGRVLSLPVYPALRDDVVDTIVALISATHDKSGDLPGIRGE
jgi:dTDP-4-amino-4,6-dideoxygalactose transaminase